MSDETGQRGAAKDIRASLSAARETVRDTPELYEFGPFRLDSAERTLLRGHEVVLLTPKAFDTLLLLVRNSGHLMEKDELIATLWPNTFVEEGASPITSSSCERPWARTPRSLKRFPGEVTASLVPCGSCRMPHQRV